jgi:nifR3 family TIM-barrel protein
VNKKQAGVRFLTSSNPTIAAEKPANPLGRPINIGKVATCNAVFLAPMSGVSDVPFRRAAWKAGAGMVTSEMVASEALVTGQSEMQLKAESAGLPVHMVQICGRQGGWMARAARLATDNGADIIDINMGCPARRVTSGYSGSALMRDLDHALHLIDSVVAATPLPVTLKMRLGWDENSINAPQLAERAVNAGVQMITVHGRTRNQFYKGRANWQAVAAVRDRIKVPLIVNGDITCREDALAAMEASGADGVMIGRAAYGSPDLPGHIAHSNGSPTGSLPHDQQPYDIVAHYEEMISFYGPELGLRCARKHIGWWFERLCVAIEPRLKQTIMSETDPGRVIERLHSIASAGKSVRAPSTTRDAA